MTNVGGALTNTPVTLTDAELTQMQEFLRKYRISFPTMLMAHEFWSEMDNDQRERYLDAYIQNIKVFRSTPDMGYSENILMFQPSNL